VSRSGLIPCPPIAIFFFSAFFLYYTPLLEFYENSRIPTVELTLLIKHFLLPFISLFPPAPIFLARNVAFTGSMGLREDIWPDHPAFSN